MASLEEGESMKGSKAGSTHLIWEQQEGQRGWGEGEVTILPPVPASNIQLQHHQ